jgi:Redoxin
LHESKNRPSIGALRPQIEVSDESPRRILRCDRRSTGRWRAAAADAVPGSDTDEAVVRAFIDKNQMVWPQVWDRERKVQQAFDIRAFPTYVLIDDEGVVRFRATGGGLTRPAGLDDAIKKQLKAAANRAKSGH